MFMMLQVKKVSLNAVGIEPATFGKQTFQFVQCGHNQSNITNIYLHLSAQHEKQ